MKIGHDIAMRLIPMEQQVTDRKEFEAFSNPNIFLFFLFSEMGYSNFLLSTFDQCELYILRENEKGERGELCVELSFE